LYSVLTKAKESHSLRLIGSLRGLAFPGADSEKVIQSLAAETTHIASLTITEKGYPRTYQGQLDVSDAGVAADIRSLKAEAATRSAATNAKTAIGLLTRGLARRYAVSGAPMTVLPCDNLTSNGALTKDLVSSFAEAAGIPGFQEWLLQSVAFPSTMVDRIVPATTAHNLAEGQQILGQRDEGLVVAEPFGQWVIEDNFAGPRPAWEGAGATLTAEVAPFEIAKLRMLNATHSLLAYLGALYGFSTISAAVADDRLADAARRLQKEDVVPTLTAPPGLDLADYGESILSRFSNPDLGHTTIQVAMDGSQKLPVRILGTVQDRLAAGEVPYAGALAVAAWMVFVHRGRDINGRELVLDDPMAAQLHAASRGSDAGLVDRLFGLSPIFPDIIASHEGFRNAVEEHVARILTDVL
jgi:fructuronate reductase